jgi:hypothetical protein
METLRGFPNLPALRLRRAKLGCANAISPHFRSVALGWLGHAGMTLLSEVCRPSAVENEAKPPESAMASELQQGGGMTRCALGLSILAALASCSDNNGGSPAGPGPDAAPGTTADVLPGSEPDALAAPAKPVHPPPCAPDEFLYDDKACSHGTSSNPDPPCMLMGDGWCHAKCTQGGTCADGFLCVAKSLCNGSDACFQTIYICSGPLHSPVGGPCRASTSLIAYPEDCVAPATCTTLTSTDCGDTATCEKTACAL